MKRVFWSCALSLLVLAVAAADRGNQPVFQIREVLDAPTVDSEQVVLIHQTSAKAQPVKEVLNVAKTPVLGDSAVKTAKVRTDEITGKPQIEINFTEQGRKQFAEIIRADLDKRLAILVDGKVICAPVIRAEITSGQALITGDFTKREAQVLADTINKVVRTEGMDKLKPWPYGLYDQLRPVK
jgi:preprotein translocase subunit SecD